VGGIDLSTSIGTLKSPGDLNLIINQIVMGHDTAFSTNLADDSIRDLAVIKSAGTPLSDKAESPRKVDALNCIAFLEKNTIWCEYTRPIRVVEKQRAIFWKLLLHEL
jgi:hypothetical protein